MHLCLSTAGTKVVWAIASSCHTLLEQRDFYPNFSTPTKMVILHKLRILTVKFGMNDAKPKVTVVIINYNSGRYLSDCLRALQEQRFREFQVVVADNDSDDDSFAAAVQMLKKESREGDLCIRLVESNENFGFAKANNLLVADVRTPLFALLNPDAVPDPDWLGNLVKAACAHGDVAMFGSTQIRMQDVSRYDGVGDNYLVVGVPWRGGYGHPLGKIEGVYEVFSPCAAAALYRTESFRSVGGFDDSYFCYGEDVDLGFRLRLSGQKCLQVADAVVHHAGGASSEGRDFAIFHGTRNMTWTFVKNMPGPIFFPLLPLHLLLLVMLVVRAVFRGQAGPTIRAIVASIRSLPRCWQVRRGIQSGRIAPIRDIARALCWFPWYYLKRAPFELRRVSSSSK